MPDAPPVTIAVCPSRMPIAAILPRRYARLPMEADDAHQRLTEERERLEQVRAGFDAEHLHDESEDESTSELSHMATHSADIATETLEREKAFSTREQVEAELADVARALRPLDD